MGKALLISKALICNYLQMGISRCGLRKMTTGNVFLPRHTVFFLLLLWIFTDTVL